MDYFQNSVMYMNTTIAKVQKLFKKGTEVAKKENLLLENTTVAKKQRKRGNGIEVAKERKNLIVFGKENTG